jgi:hypothetical protein
VLNNRAQGLVCKSRTNLQHHKEPFAHDVEFCPDLLTAIKTLKPTALVGVSTIAKAFNKEVSVGVLCDVWVWVLWCQGYNIELLILLRQAL